MPRRTSIAKHTLAALAAGALLASPATARTADDAVPGGARAPLQDLRGEHARDAASGLTATASPRQDLRGEHARDAARAYEAPVTAVPAPPTAVIEAPSSSQADDGVGDENAWRIVGAGLAAAGVAAGGFASISRRHRLRARRVVA